MNDEQKYRTKVLKIFIIILAIAYCIGNLIATQMAASYCNYNELLGANLSFGNIHIYPFYDYYVWSHNKMIMSAIPNVLGYCNRYIILSMIAGLLFGYFLTRGLKKNDSHGSASFATSKDIYAAGLGDYKVIEKKKKLLCVPYKEKVKVLKTSGVVVGINPFTGNLMLDDEPTHTLLIAPTRSGKGVNTIIPTGLIWQHSAFFFDVKGELWQSTAGYRQKVLHQKVMKFEPLCTDGSSARWNPLAEINFRTTEELSDVSTIVSMLVKPDGEKAGGSDPFWDNSAAALLNGIILHLLYKYYQENKPLPCPTCIFVKCLLSRPDC